MLAVSLSLAHVDSRKGIATTKREPDVGRVTRPAG